MLRNILTTAVPGLAAEHVDHVLTTGLESANLSRDDISGWILHAGGREILAAIRQRLGLSEEETRWSAAILRDYGNVSSPCVYFVLQAALAEEAPGGHWWMSSFGAGFSCHGVLLAVE
jgi:alkylresorcinol/alkylpyrone synthase